MSARHRQAGFTLVETLVALALLGALGLLMAGALQAATGAWRRSLTLTEEPTLQAGLQAALDRQLGQAQPLFINRDPQDARIAFAGEPAAVGFTGPLPLAIAPGILGPQRLELAAADRALVLAWKAPDGSAAGILPVLDGVRALHLRYWSAPAPDDPGGWRADWLDRPRLPGLIALELERLQGPPLAFLVAPRLTASPGCLFDPVGPACRKLP